MAINLEIGDKLFTAKDAGYLLFVGDNKAQAYIRQTSGDYALNSAVKPLNEVQIARWIELKTRDGASAHMDAK